MSLPSGTRFGPYEITALIGVGGMGEVYRARDGRLGRDVAIKVLPPAFMADPERRKRFEREARTLAALNHPNILAVFDVGTHDGSPYLVTELLEGETLRARLAKGALPVRCALDLALQVVRGLTAAHGKGLIHRDLKPSNIFLTQGGISRSSISVSPGRRRSRSSGRVSVRLRMNRVLRWRASPLARRAT